MSLTRTSFDGNSLVVMKALHLTTKRTIAVCLVWFAVANPLKADYPESTPEVIIASVKEYKENGPEAFAQRFIKGSVTEMDKSQASGMVVSFSKISEQFGKFVEAEIIRNDAITSKVTRCYLAMHYERGVLFCRVDCYTRPDGQSVILRGVWDADSYEAFPWELTKSKP